MKHNLFSKLLVLPLAGLAACTNSESTGDSEKSGVSEQPNILIVFTDDQGYSDLGCYGSELHKTPNLDQLAKEGTRFTSFYAQAVSGPSRSALLTGRYPHRSLGWGMPAEETTFAELMQEQGYHTACIGKWDVSNRKPVIPRMPNAQGFDYYFGPLGANDNAKLFFYKNNQFVDSTGDMSMVTRLYTNKAIDFLENKWDTTKPFILYVAHTMLHTIIDASPEFKGKTAGSLYGDALMELDYETGRLLKTLDKLGLEKNTLVIFTTDNGPWNQPAYTDHKKGHPEGAKFWGDCEPLRAGKGSCYEGGYRVPCIMRWPGKVPAGRVSDAMFATLDFLPTFANLAGFEVPDDRIIDGVDQTDLILGENDEGARETFYYFYNGVRQGKWKYLRAEHKISGYAKDDERAHVEELYNLEEDISETNNLAEEYPEIVERLRKLTEEIEGEDIARWDSIGGYWYILD